MCVIVLNVIMLSAFIINVIQLHAIMPNGITIIAIMANDIITFCWNVIIILCWVSLC